MARPLETAARCPYLLIELANKHDRFQLLDDPLIPSPDLDIPIHPIFQASNFINAGSATYQNLEQSLRLASMFLCEDSVLEWFVAPLSGLPLVDLQSGKTYLSDPLAIKTGPSKRALLERVRAALACMSHCVQFRFFANDIDAKFYARTTINARRPVHDHRVCTPYFQPATSVLIELRKQYCDFLSHHYSSSSLCERLRHDFCLAVAFVHEICHAVGVMRRGDLVEPHIRLDHLAKPEFGYAWENFMFGGIINPFDRTSSRISFLMRKIWSDDNVAQAAGGKEWTAIPMSYIAQWFRKETWRSIAKFGPAVIVPPIVHLKLRAQATYYTVLTDHADAVADVQAKRRELVGLYRDKVRLSTIQISIMLSKVVLTSATELQRYLAPVPSRSSARTSITLKEATVQSRCCSGSMRAYSDHLPMPMPVPDTFRQAHSISPLKRRCGAETGSDDSTTGATSDRPEKRIKL